MSVSFPSLPAIRIPGLPGDHAFQPPLVMGILNVTPDSFSDGGRLTDMEAAVQQAERMLQEGADLIDIGGESTRPGAAPVSADEEVARTAPVIRKLRQRGCTAPISIDTMKSQVAAAALEAGANIVNDVTAGERDAGMLALCAERACTLILMHMRGSPKDMQAQASYSDVVSEVRQYLRAPGDCGDDPAPGEQPDPVRAYAEEAQFNYPVLIGQQSGIDAASAFGVELYAMPVTIFLTL